MILKPPPASAADDSDISQLRQRVLTLPVQGVNPAQLSDTYTQSRAAGAPHEAIDIMSARGTPVLAVEDGKVARRHHDLPVRSGQPVRLLLRPPGPLCRRPCRRRQPAQRPGHRLRRQHWQCLPRRTALAFRDLQAGAGAAVVARDTPEPLPGLARSQAVTSQRKRWKKTTPAPVARRQHARPCRPGRLVGERRDARPRPLTDATNCFRFPALR